jgi:hypothetical protein
MNKYLLLSQEHYKVFFPKHKTSYDLKGLRQTIKLIEKWKNETNTRTKTDN